MPFKRLPTSQEIRKMSFVLAYAVEIEQKDIEWMVKNHPHAPLPRYLKRVKRTDRGKTLLLVEINKKTTSKTSIVPVQIPEFEPITQTQFEEACAVWPCYFYKPYEKEINEKEIEFQWDFFRNKKLINSGNGNLNGNICAGICAIFDGKRFITSSYDIEPIIRHSVAECITRTSQNKMGHMGYLCTGLTAWLAREPCISCAMALVHGRIYRVFVQQQVDGGIFSSKRLNYNEHLNHRFNVYFYQ